MSPIAPTAQSSLYAPAEPAPCPGCGGGGGGSVTPGTPPSISGDSTNVTYLIPGVPIRLSATVSSYGTLGTGGSGSDVLFYDITNSLGQVSASATMSISTTGTYSFVWTPTRSQIGWGGVYVYQPGVYNSCEEGCGTGWGSTIDIQIYEDAPSNLNTSVYDSNGDLIARYTQSSLAFGGTAPVPYIQVGAQVQFSFATATNWTDSVSDGTKVLGIWQVTEAINPNFALFGYSGGSASMGLGYIQDGLQVESNDDFEVYVGDYLIGIANAFLFDLIPELPPWWFEDTNGNGVDYYSQSTYSVTDTGTTQFYLCGKTCGETAYYPIKDSSGTPTRLFDLHTYNDYYSNQVTSYLDVNAYTVTLEYQYGDNIGGANTYTSSATLYTGSWILYYP